MEFLNFSIYLAKMIIEKYEKNLKQNN